MCRCGNGVDRSHNHMSRRWRPVEQVFTKQCTGNTNTSAESICAQQQMPDSANQAKSSHAGTTRAAQETLLCERACKSVRSNSPGIRIAGTKPCRRRLPATSKGQCYLRKRRSVPAQAATRTTRALGHCQHSHPNGQWRRPQRLHRAASGQPAPTSRMGQVPKAPAAHTIRAVSQVGTRS